MKKLLLSLAPLSVVAGSATVIVSCSTSNNTKNNSIFINGDGDLNIDSEKLLQWYLEHNGFEAETMLPKLNSYYAVSLFENARALNEEQIINLEQNNYLDEGTIKKMVESYGSKKDSDANSSTVWGNAKKSYNSKKDEYKNDKSFKKYLEEKFPHVDKTWEKLENAFLSDYILNDAEHGALATLRDILAFNDPNNNYNTSIGNTTVWNTNDQIHLTSFNDKVQKYKQENENDMTTWIKRGVEAKDADFITSFITLANSVGGLSFSTADLSSKGVQFITDKASFDTLVADNNIELFVKKFNREGDKLSITNSPKLDFNDQETFLNFEGNKPTNWIEVTNQIPNIEVKTIDNNGTSELKITTKETTIGNNYGLLKNTQKYFIDDYFQTKKPIAISDFIIKPVGTESINLTNGVTMNNFLKDETSLTESDLSNQFKGFDSFDKNYLNVETAIDPFTGLTRFDTIFKGSEYGQVSLNGLTNQSWDNKYFELGANSSLLTIDSTEFSDVAKFSIYDYISKDENSRNKTRYKRNEATKKTWKEAGVYTNSVNLDEIIKKAGVEAEINQFATLLEAVNQAPNSTKVNQKEEHKFYQSFKNGNEVIINYVDEKGMHFTKIEGIQYLNTTTKDQEKTTWGKNVSEGRQKDSMILNQLNALDSTQKKLVPYITNNASSPNNSQSKSQSKANNESDTNWNEKDPYLKGSENKTLSDNAKDTKIDASNLNSFITNDYERWLVNTSIFNNMSKNNDDKSKFYKFNLLDDVKNSMIGDEAKNQLYWIWQLSSQVLGKEISELFIKMLGTEKPNELVIGMAEQIEKGSQHSRNIAINDFAKANKTWKTNVHNNAQTRKEEIEKLTSTEDVKGEWKKFIIEEVIEFDDAKLDKLEYNEKIYPYKKEQNQFYTKTYKLSQNEIARYTTRRVGS